MVRNAYKGTAAEVEALSAYVKLVRAAESVSSRIHGHLSGYGLTVSQFGVLEALHHLGTLTQSEIAKKILKSTGNITMVIDNLEKRGLVRRGPNPQDRRSYAVRLTPAGRTMIASLFPLHAEGIVRGMSALSRTEQKTLGNLCRKLGTDKPR